MSNLSKTIKIAGNNIISKNILITSKPQSHMKLNRDIIAKKINSFDDSKNENKTSLKKKARSSSNLKQNEKNFILVHDSSGIQGGGLWCQAQKIYPNEKDTSYVSILPKLNSKPNLDAESYVDKKLIENLRIQIKDLTHKLSDKIAKYTDAEYRAERANNLKKIMEENLNTKEQELKTYRENNIQMKIEIESLNNALSNAIISFSINTFILDIFDKSSLWFVNLIISKYGGCAIKKSTFFLLNLLQQISIALSNLLVSTTSQLFII